MSASMSVELLAYPSHMNNVAPSDSDRMNQLQSSSHSPHPETNLPSILLEEDMLEVKCHRFLAGTDSNSACSVWVGFAIASLPVELVSTCNLNPYNYVAIRLRFCDPPIYGSSCPTRQGKQILILQTSKSDFSDLYLCDCEPFPFGWTLEQRLEIFLQSNWDEISRNQQCAIRLVPHQLITFAPTRHLADVRSKPCGPMYGRFHIREG